MPHPTEHTRPGSGQRGFVLLTTVILLVVLAALSLSAMRGTLQQERMASNERDMALARQNAELALRDAERDLLGIDVNGNFCNPAGGCPNARLAGHRPTPPVPPATLSNFWLFNASSDTPWDEMALLNGGAGQALNRRGLLTHETHRACGADGGSRAVWLAADWVDHAPAGRCDTTSALGAISLPTIAYGTFTGATPPPDTPAPRYLMEMLPVAESGGVGSKVVFRITAMGFGRTSTDNRRTAVMLQTVFSPR